MSRDCRCCGSPTLEERDAWEVCRTCGWEDDPLQASKPDYAGGANIQSLSQARLAWQMKQSLQR
jgi:hypothetical protein